MYLGTIPSIPRRDIPAIRRRPRKGTLAEVPTQRREFRREQVSTFQIGSMHRRNWKLRAGVEAVCALGGWDGKRKGRAEVPCCGIAWGSLRDRYLGT